MTVVVSDEAWADLTTIQDYIALRNPERASEFIEDLLHSCDDLSNMPMAYPIVARYERAGVRRRPHGNYSIFYRIIEDTVLVIHILNGARDHEALLFPEPD
jgi:plasmid stabilization system protein ParE